MLSSAPYDDPTMAPFWDAAREHRLILQRCDDCRRWQFYPRPFCLGCMSLALGWTEASGRGTVYTRTTMHLPVVEHLEPPYVVAVVQLREGPRLVTNLVGDRLPAIDDPVVGQWVEREAGLPPRLVFRGGA